jgi:dihydrolipoamide dehydrogenase
VAVIEIKVPDIGDFKDVPVIELLVKPGDTVKKEDSLVTLESDKATMDVPSPQAGQIRELRVKVGDKVSQGTVIALVEAQDGAAKSAETKGAEAKSAETKGAEAKPAQEARRDEAKKAGDIRQALSSTLASLDADVHAEVLVLGAGPGGYTAAFRAADLGKKVVLVER